MNRLSYTVSPAYGFEKGAPFLAGMVAFGALSFLYWPLALVCFILFFPFAFLVYSLNRTTYELSGEQLTVSRGQNRQTVDLSAIISFRVDTPLWMSFFSAERAFFKNSAGQEVRIYLFGHQLMNMFRQLPSLNEYPTLL